jgi:hypothetical protein
MTQVTPKKLSKRNRCATAFDKTVHCRQIIDGQRTVHAVAKLFKVEVKTVQKWLQKVRRGYVLRGGPGQPPAISPDHLQKVVQIAQDSPFDLTAEDFTKRLLDEKRATENEVNKASKGIDGLSRTTIRNYAKKANMKECFAEVATASRVIATTDVYNFVAFAAMNKFMVHSKGINQLLIMNAG